jgi:hypothetical protein
MMSIGTRFICLLFDIFCVIYSYDQIVIDSVFIHYCITLSIIFLSILNIIRIEYVYSKNTEEEYDSWKKKNYGNTNLFFVLFENICKTSFLFHSFPMNYWNLYTISILIIHISTILFLMMIVFSILYMICTVLSNQSKRSIQPIDANDISNISDMPDPSVPNLPNLPNIPIDTIVSIDTIHKSLNECSICLEVNNNKIIKTACNHEFHEKCLFEWIKISMTCPICRGGII